MHIVITGASSGIGAALAVCYAKQPNTKLVLTGRNEERLEAIAQNCRNLGAEVSSAVVDVCNQEAMRELISSTARSKPVDLVVANAGVSSTTVGAQSDRALMEINVFGVMNTVQPALEEMLNTSLGEHAYGQIAIVSSVAGYFGLAGAPAYSASKAAVKVWGEALRARYAHHQGIRISVICPGFVRSRLTDANKFSMPFLMEADKAAKIIQRGLAKNKPRITFPWQMALLAWMVSALPARGTTWLTAILPRKV